MENSIQLKSHLTGRPKGARPSSQPPSHCSKPTAPAGRQAGCRSERSVGLTKVLSGRREHTPICEGRGRGATGSGRGRGLDYG